VRRSSRWITGKRIGSHMMTQLQQELEEKEKALERLQAVVQEHRGARKPSISTADASTMTETTLVSSPSIDISQEKLGEFEKHTRGIGSKLLRKMGYDGQGIGKRRQGILSPIVVTPWAKHEGLGFDGRSENSITMKKTIFVKEKDMSELACSSGEGETTVSEGVSSPPPHPCGRLKERNNEESLQTHPTPTLRDNNKPINEKRRRRRPGGLHQTRNFLFVTVARREAIP
jgi:hypothetical protein